MEKIKRNIAKLLISINDGEFDGYGQNTISVVYHTHFKDYKKITKIIKIFIYNKKIS
ncbi:hypothetical protein [Spiroplasma phoeniceum]|nr:hypothetical protein [Spiroplasma phoeniceum]